MLTKEELAFLRDWRRILDMGLLGTHAAAIVIAEHTAVIGFDRTCELGNKLTADFLGCDATKH